MRAASTATEVQWRELAIRLLEIADPAELVFRVSREFPGGSRQLDAAGAPSAIEDAYAIASRAVAAGEATSFVTRVGGRRLSLGAIDVELLTLGGLRINDDIFFCANVAAIEPAVVWKSFFVGVFQDAGAVKCLFLAIIDAGSEQWSRLETWSAVASRRADAAQLLASGRIDGNGISFDAAEKREIRAWSDLHWRKLPHVWNGHEARA